MQNSKEFEYKLNNPVLIKQFEDLKQIFKHVDTAILFEVFISQN